MSTPRLEPAALPIMTIPPAAVTSAASRERDRLIRRAKALSWLSLAYMTVEGAVGITAALLAGSVALLGFGLDSAIEGLASIIVIWRFTGSRRLSELAEQRAQRLVAITFVLLAPYIARTRCDADRRRHPQHELARDRLSISSLIVMPLLGEAKQRLGERLGSGATAGEGAQNMLCAYLAAGVLAGLALNAALGWWWADPPLRSGSPRSRCAKAATLARRRLLRPPAIAGDCHDDCCA